MISKLKGKKRIVRFIIVILMIASVLGMAGYTLFIKPGLEEDVTIYKEAVVEYGDLVMGIVESGSIAAEEESQNFTLNLETEEDEEEDDDSDDEDEDTTKYLEIEESYIVIGQRVSQGDEIYRLTEDSVESVRNKLELEAAEAQTALAEAQLSFELDTLDAQNTLQSSAAKGNAAGDIYKNSIAQLNNEIADLNAKVTASKRQIDIYSEQIFNLQADDDGSLLESYEEAKEDYEEADKENEMTFVAKQAAYLEAKEAYESYVENLKTLQEQMTAQEEKVIAYQLEIEGTKAELTRTTLEAKQTYETETITGSIAPDTYEYAKGTLEEAVVEAQTAVEEANEKLTDFETFVGDGSVYAQSDGLIMSVNYETGDSLINSGELFTYVTQDSITLSVDVSQEDIVDLAVGDSVSIAFTAYPDENYSGEITAITTTATSEHATTISYPVTIKVLGDTSKLYEGMTGDVTFVTDQKEQTAYVSRKAIIEENGNTYVYQKNKNGDMILTEVETGFTDGINIEIISGLEADDVIYIASKITNEGEEE
ncbi:MAG: HlyD family efflux transporter periplasmic adaptor subunit [Lachnospiraceae bacterium]|nr:HlyD family efflux transporter periplasmic adaptor subunit [Lachnospiraceae bacterium]